MYCSHCGTVIDDGVKYCSSCGADQTAKQTTTSQQPVIVNVVNQNTNTNTVGGYSHPQKSKGAALALCFFFGCLGIHRFYVGKTGTGLLYLFTGGLFVIGALVDFFTILFGGFRDSFGQPLA